MNIICKHKRYLLLLHCLMVACVLPSDGDVGSSAIRGESGRSRIQVVAGGETRGS